MTQWIVKCEPNEMDALISRVRAFCDGRSIDSANLKAQKKQKHVVLGFRPRGFAEFADELRLDDYLFANAEVAKIRTFRRFRGFIDKKIPLKKGYGMETKDDGTLVFHYTGSASLKTVLNRILLFGIRSGGIPIFLFGDSVKRRRLKYKANHG